MRVLICGSRNWKDRLPIKSLIDQLPYHCVVVHGGCKSGADWIADRKARRAGLRVEVCPVNHELDGPWPGAGPRRNARMLRDHGPFDLAFAFRSEGESRGTDDTIRRAKSLHIPTFVIHEGGQTRIDIPWHQLTLATD